MPKYEKSCIKCNNCIFVKKDRVGKDWLKCRFGVWEKWPRKHIDWREGGIELYRRDYVTSRSNMFKEIPNKCKLYNSDKPLFNVIYIPEDKKDKVLPWIISSLSLDFEVLFY